MKKFIFDFTVILSMLFLQNTFISQYQSYKINPGNQYFYSEVCIKINPKNSNQLVAGVMGEYTGTTSVMGYYYTTNSGVNWSGGPITCDFAQPGSDPMILADTLGNFYYICCANWGITGPNLDKLLCFKSTNGGANWSGGTAFALMAPQMDDMPMACVDMSNSRYGNNIYVTWDLYDKYPSANPLDSCYVAFCRSTNSGASFSTPVHISRIAGTAKCDNSSPEGTSPCTGPNGEVYVCWPLNETIMFNRSTNAGVNWLYNDIYVCNQVGGWVGLNANSSGNWSPVSACDISNSPYRGTIYICFADQRNGPNDRDIWLVKSTNQGNNWSAPKRVNNDGAGNDQRMPWICVDKETGYVWIVFYDSRYNAASMSNVFVARSTDGGNTFQNVRINTTNIYNGYYLGEYMGIDAVNNKVRPLWARPLGVFGYAEVYTTIIDTLLSSIEHMPIQSSKDTSRKTAIAYMNIPSPIGTGTNAPRLYYKTGNNSYQYVNAFSITAAQYNFQIPGQSAGTNVSYYIAAQDSAGTSIITYPPGGGGINPPGTTPPPTIVYYEIFSDYNQCSNTLPKPILDNQATRDTITINRSGYVVNAKVNLTINHPNDGDLIIQLRCSGMNVNLSQRLGEGGQNFINTTFDDDASVQITQGSPPFTGAYRPQSPLNVLSNKPLSGIWTLNVIDAASGNQGTLANWCIMFQVKASISVNEEEVPVKYELSQNYPNPFNSSTRINYSIPKNTGVEIKIYDMLGREIRTLVNEYQNAGNYAVIFSSGELASGMYFYRIKAGDFSEVKRMVLVK
ncbi:MAG: T9SS type A sorting domain-containing protein [Ignavibacteria bacterium]|nr:T9SS type A sorting domain-containing protein [Ignavibacteria bacterium]